MQCVTSFLAGQFTTHMKSRVAAKDVCCNYSRVSHKEAHFIHESCGRFASCSVSKHVSNTSLMLLTSKLTPTKTSFCSLL